MLAIFFRYPILGAVKKRLEVSVGQQEALRIYKQLLFHTLNVAKSTEFPVIYVVDQFSNSDSELVVDPTNSILQEGDDLGQRMSLAFSQLENKSNKVVLIGADIPHISKHIINDAFTLLDHVDYVIGPSFDGGFYLIGTKCWNSLIFNAVPWSSDQTMTILLKNLEALSLSYTTLKSLMDIDIYEDLEFCKMMNL